jgi:hypothetical protein
MLGWQPGSSGTELRLAMRRRFDLRAASKPWNGQPRRYGSSVSDRENAKATPEFADVRGERRVCIDWLISRTVFCESRCRPSFVNSD